MQADHSSIHLPTNSHGNWTARCVVTCLSICLLLHSWQCLHHFGGWQQLTNDAPILQVDHALHLYHGWLGAQFLLQTGRDWGYDPAFMAGYPKTPWHDPSSFLATVSQLLTAGNYSPSAYKWLFFLTLWSGPWLAYTGWRGLGWSAAQASAALPLWLLYLWGCFPCVLIDSGLFSFVFVSQLLPGLSALVVRWSDRGKYRDGILLVLGLTVGLWSHPTVALMFAGPLLMFYLIRFRIQSWRWHGASWLAVSLVGVGTMGWWWPAWHFRPYHDIKYIFLRAAADDYWFFWQFYQTHPFELNILLLFLIGGWPAWQSLHKSGRSLLPLLLVWLAGCTFFGSLWQVTQTWEPLRFQVPLHFLLVSVSGPAFIWMWSGSSGRWSPRWCRAGLFCLWLGCQLFWPALPLAWQAIRYQRPLPMGLQPEMLALLEWLQTHTERDGRILLEDQLRLLERTVPESLHWTCLLPIYVDREFIGGQYQTTPLLHHYAAYGDYQLGNRPIQEWSPTELQHFIEQYHIRWIVAWSLPSRSVWEACPLVRPLGSLPRHTSKPAENQYFCYEVLQPANYFHQGSGRVVQARLNTIELADIVPEAGAVILQYHGFDYWQSEPPIPIDTVKIGKDPVGFIRLHLDKPMPRILLRIQPTTAWQVQPALGS